MLLGPSKELHCQGTLGSHTQAVAIVDAQAKVGIALDVMVVLGIIEDAQVGVGTAELDVTVVGIAEVDDKPRVEYVAMGVIHDGARL